MSGSFIGLKPTKETKKVLQEYITKIGLKDSITLSKLHITLFYSLETIEGFKPDSDTIYEANVISYGFMGKKEFAALVLNLFSLKMTNKHNMIKNLFRVEHGHKGFSPHVTLKYGPDPSEISLLSGNDPRGMKLYFTGEYIEPIKQRN